MAISKFQKTCLRLSCFLTLLGCGSHGGGIVDNGVKPEPEGKELEQPNSDAQSGLTEYAAVKVLGSYQVSAPAQGWRVEDGLHGESILTNDQMTISFRLAEKECRGVAHQGSMGTSIRWCEGFAILHPKDGAQIEARFESRDETIRYILGSFRVIE